MLIAALRAPALPPASTAPLACECRPLADHCCGARSATASARPGRHRRTRWTLARTPSLSSCSSSGRKKDDTFILPPSSTLCHRAIARSARCGLRVDSRRTDCRRTADTQRPTRRRSRQERDAAAAASSRRRRRAAHARRRAAVALRSCAADVQTCHTAVASMCYRRGAPADAPPTPLAPGRCHRRAPTPRGRAVADAPRPTRGEHVGWLLCACAPLRGCMVSLTSTRPAQVLCCRLRQLSHRFGMSRLSMAHVSQTSPRGAHGPVVST